MGFAIQTGPLITVAGTGILPTYGSAGASMFVTRAQVVRVYVHAVLAVGSPITRVLAKIQYRYNDGTFTSGFIDLPTTLNDPLGTTEIEHSFVVAAGASADFGFSVLNPLGIDEIVVLLRTNKTGVVGDSLTAFAESVS